jgi:hypothetical protein
MRVEGSSSVRRGLGGADDIDAVERSPSNPQQKLNDAIDANEAQGRAGRELLGGARHTSTFELILQNKPYEPELGDKPWKDIPFALDGAAAEAMAQLNVAMQPQTSIAENPVQAARMGDQAPDVKPLAELRERERKQLDISDMLSAQRIQGVRGTTSGRYD